MTALNFDPYAALAEIENGSGLRDKGDNRANPGQSLAPLAPLALSPARKSKTAPPQLAQDCPDIWRARLDGLDTETAPDGFSPDRWRAMLCDARWIARNHADAAAAFGWSASDLFGVDPVRDGWGGLADRLEGARRLAFTAGVAHWRGENCEGWLWRRTLTAKPIIWEATA